MIAVNGITLNLFLANGFFMPWAAFEIVSLPKIYQHKGLRRAQPASKKCQWVRQILHCCLQKRNCIKGRDGGKFWLLVLLCEDPSQLEYPELAILTGCKICSNSLLLCLPTSLSLENTNLNWAERQSREEMRKKNGIQTFLFLKMTWLFPWAWEVWERILTVTGSPSPGVLVIPSCLWSPGAGWEEATQKRSHIAHCNCHNSLISPSFGNFFPKMVLNWAVRPAWVTLLSEAKPLPSKRDPQSRPLYKSYPCTVRDPFFWPSSSSTPPSLSHPYGLALRACSADTCNGLPASSCACPQWPHLTVTFKLPSGNNFNSCSEWLLWWLHS